MPPDLKTARVYFSCLGGDDEREKAGRGPAPRRRIPAARSRTALPAALRARAASSSRTSPSSAARASRSSSTRCSLGRRMRTARRRRDLRSRGPEARLPAPARQARGPDVARRRRARPQGHGPVAASATAARSIRWRRGCCCSAPGGAARLQGFFTLMDKSYEGVIRLGRATTTYDREGETVGAERDASGVTAARVAEASRGLPRGVPAVSSAVLGQEGRRPQVLRDGAQGRGGAVAAEEGPGHEPRPSANPRPGGCPSPSPARPERTSARSRASSARSSAAAPTSRPSGARASAHFAPKTRCRSIASSRSRPTSVWRRRTRCRSRASRSPFPGCSSPRWRPGRSGGVSRFRPAASPRARETGSPSSGPTDDMLALGQVNPIGDRGVAMIKPRIVLA